MSGKLSVQKGQETVTPVDTSANNLTAIEMGSARFAMLAVDTLDISTSANWTLTCEYSYDKTNWYKVKLPSNSATNWSKLYTASIASAEFVYMMDSTVMIPIPAPFARFVATLGTFGGTPTMTVRQGAFEI